MAEEKTFTINSVSTGEHSPSNETFKIQRVYEVSPPKREDTSEGNLVVSSPVMEVMRERAGLDDGSEQEFLLFSRQSGSQVDTIVPVGTPGKSKANITYDPQEEVQDPHNVHQVIRQHLQKGYTLVGDFHNHPSSTGEIMRQNGKPVEHGVCPSVSDTSELTEFIERDFGVHMVRVIGGTMDERVVIKAFEVLRIPEPFEFGGISFFGKGTWTKKMRINEYYADYDEMVKRNIVREVPISEQ